MKFFLPLRYNAGWLIFSAKESDDGFGESCLFGSRGEMVSLRVYF